MTISLIKKEARDCLKGYWLKSFLFTLFFFALQIIFSLVIYFITKNTAYILFGNIVYIIISISLSYGLTCSLIKLKRKEKCNPLHIFYFTFKDFDRFWRLIGRLLFSLLFYILADLLCLYLVIYSYLLYINQIAGLDISFVLGIIGIIAFSVLLVLKSLYFTLNNFILFDNSSKSSKEILLESKRLMTNNRWNFFKLILSFSGWFILAILFVLGVFFLFRYFNILVSVSYIILVPMIFIIPYIIVSMICFYDTLLKNSPKEVEKNNLNTKKKKNKKHKK